MELFNPNSNIDFLAKRKISLAISIILILVSLGLLATRGLNYALDFTGGVLVEGTYEQPAEIDQVRSALETGGFHGASYMTGTALTKALVFGFEAADAVVRCAARSRRD